MMNVAASFRVNTSFSQPDPEVVHNARRDAQRAIRSGSIWATCLGLIRVPATDLGTTVQSTMVGSGDIADQVFRSGGSDKL